MQIIFKKKVLFDPGISLWQVLLLQAKVVIGAIDKGSLA